MTTATALPPRARTQVPGSSRGSGLVAALGPLLLGSRLGFGAPVLAVGLRPVVPVRHGVLHRPEEWVHAGVADELEALLQVRGELLVVIEGAQVLPEAAGALQLEQRVRVVDDRGDLRPAADDALVLRERVDLAVAHPRDALHLEVA